MYLILVLAAGNRFFTAAACLGFLREPCLLPVGKRLVRCCLDRGGVRAALLFEEVEQRGL